MVGADLFESSVVGGKGGVEKGRKTTYKQETLVVVVVVFRR